MSATLHLQSLRPVRKEEYPSLLCWLNAIFHPGKPNYFQTEYNHLFHEGEAAGETSFVMEHEGSLLGHIGIYPLELKTSIGVLKVAGIGQVAVHPSTRGQGLMRAMMKEAHEISKREGYALSLLGGNRSLYSRFGYEISGAFYEWMWDRQGCENLDSLREPSGDGDLQAIYRSWAQRPYGTLWSWSAFKRISRRPQWDRWIYDAGSGNGLASYAFVRRENSRRVVDCCGGEPPFFKPMMDSLCKHYRQPLYIRHCVGDRAMHRWMELLGMDIARKSESMLKILNASRIEPGAACPEPARNLLREIEGNELSCEPEAIGLQRNAVRRLFGDPFDRFPTPGAIHWECERLSCI